MLREQELVGIRLRPLGNATYVACLPLLCQGSKWLTSIQKVLGSHPSWIPFFPVDSLNQKTSFMSAYCHHQ